jgi:hypothetical protein
VASPPTTELFAGRVNVRRLAFYSFSVVENGTVNVNLADVGGPTCPPPYGWGSASARRAAKTAPRRRPSIPPRDGDAAHRTYAPGVYCVRVWDIGNLVAVAAFNVTIAHP